MPSRALLTEVQTISNAEIVQALANVKIVATSGITTTLPSTSSTLAILAGQTFTGTQAFSGVINIVATTSTTGQITQASTRLLHTYGTQNLFLGAGAGNFNITGTGQNIGIGRISLSSLTYGVQNACIGDQAGSAITTGSTNMLMGYASGNLINTGSANVAIGVSCLTQVTSTSNNVAIGYQSLGSTTGSSSTGVGHNAGYYATGGNGTYIGQGAGIATSTIGGLAGVAITSAVNCTMLGQGSGSTSATGDYRTAIGSDSRCNAANAIKLGRDTLDRVIFPSWTADPTTDLVVGMVIYRSDTPALKIYTSAGWKTITAT